MNESTQDFSKELNKTLESTELGHIINENKTAVIVSGIVILIAIIAFSFYKYQQNNNLEAKLADTYAFQTKAVTPYMEDKITEAEFLKEFEALPAHTLETEAFLPIALKVAHKMADAGKNTEAIKVLESYYGKISSKTLAHYLLSVNYAAYLEDASQGEKAISVLEDAMKTKFETLKDKVYFDLGRLYLGAQNKEKATEMFEYVNKNFPDSQFSRLANLYLAGMNK